MRKITVLIALLFCVQAAADEGMWMLGNLNKATRNEMKKAGLQMKAGQIYHPKKASLKDAVVSFGGFCSGVVVSEDGLVFTNHHCGFSSIQQHSTIEKDYLKDGFIARNRSEELPNPELYVRFLLSTDDVTKRVLEVVKPEMSESDRRIATDSVMIAIQEEVYAKDSTLVAIVDAFYGGNEFWLSVYRDFNDVRLVFAPPSSIGKFGWDTDNWMWPRHTGDFSVFRIYADKNNQAADYSPDNVPYKPKYVAPVSLNGYVEGSYSMTLGYPGFTQRYLSSFGIEERMNGMNQAMIDIRGVKQDIWKAAMDKSDDIRIKYATKYDESSNYWKNSIGTNRAIKRLNVLERKRAMESSLRQWIRETPSENQLIQLLSSLELNYKARRANSRAMAYFGESFLNGPELMQLAIEILNFDYGADQRQVMVSFTNILDKYANLDLNIDQDVFTALIGEYRKHMEPRFYPEFFRVIETEYGGSDRAFVDSLYAESKITTPTGLRLFLDNDSTYNLLEDPAVSLGIDLIVKLYDINQEVIGATELIEKDERLYNAAIRRMYAARNFYPDANSTMRLSYGTVRGYEPYDGAEYNYFTTTKGVLEKERLHKGDRDFYVQPEILEMFKQADFGRYADKSGNMNVCFISDNDITGGNSGSAMFNAKGELIGLAFDGNWEAMSSDMLYEPKLQRCVGVDVRYMLYIIDKFGKAGNIIQELKLK